MKNNKISLLALALILSNTISPTETPKVETPKVETPEVKPSRLSNVMSHLGAHKGKYGAAVAIGLTGLAAYNDVHNKIYNYFVSTSDIKTVSEVIKTEEVIFTEKAIKTEDPEAGIFGKYKVVIGISAAVAIIGTGLLYFIKNKNTPEDDSAE